MHNKRVGKAFGGFNFGIVAIDLGVPEPYILLQIHDVNGTVKEPRRIPLSDLR